MTQIKFTRISSDTNGNPRYVCHFQNLVTNKDRSGINIKFGYGAGYISELYRIALKRAKKLGGRKFHNKQYGGGIVFQSYDIEETERRIKELLTA